MVFFGFGSFFAYLQNGLFFWRVSFWVFFFGFFSYLFGKTGELDWNWGKKNWLGGAETSKITLKRDGLVGVVIFFFLVYWRLFDFFVLIFFSSFLLSVFLLWGLQAGHAVVQKKLAFCFVLCTWWVFFLF